MRKVLAIVFGLMVMAAPALAQVPAGNVFFGYSYNRADTFVVGRSGGTNLNGWEGSLEGKIFPYVGIVADIGAQYGAQDTGLGRVTGAVHSYIFGPRVSFSVSHFRPYAHFLFGIAHESNDSIVPGLSHSDTAFADAIGGGIDYKLIPAVAWRVQADVLQTRFFSDTQNDFRFSTGIVVNF